ncbi:MAG: hypothetical protein Q9165_003526 [Trypethelium subeluteriae]
MDNLSDTLDDLSLKGDLYSVEECSVATEIGAFVRAQEYLERSSSRTTTEPDFAIALARLLLKQCRYGQCSAFLARLSQEGTLDSYPADTQPLLKLMKALADLHSQGCLAKALETARIARKELEESSPENFTISQVVEISSRAGRMLSAKQILSVEYYLRIIKHAETWSSWLHPNDKTVPWSLFGAEPWSGFLKWHVILTEGEHFLAAFTILQLCRDVVPQQIYTRHAENFLSAVSTQDSRLEKISQLITRNLLARHWADIGNFDEAKGHYKAASALAAHLSGAGLATKGTSLGLEMQLAWLEISTRSDLSERITKLSSIAQSAKDNHDWGRADWCLTQASEDAMQLLDSELFSNLRKNVEELQLTEMGDLPSLVIGRSRHWRYSGAMNRAKQIEWFDNFDADHPDFDVPLALHVKETAKAMIFDRIGDKHRHTESEVQLQHLAESLPSGRVRENLATYLQPFADTQPKDHLGPLKVLSHWLNVCLHNRMIEKHTLRFLLDIRAGEVTEPSFELLNERLFKKPGNALWPGRLALLQMVLSEDDTMTDDGAANYLLVRLQLLRTMYVDPDPKEVIQVNKDMIDLITRAPVEVRQIFRRNELHCRSVVGVARIQDMGSAQSQAEANEVIDTFAQALEQYREPSLSRYLGDIALLHVRLADAGQRARRVFGEPSLAFLEYHLEQAEQKFTEMRQELTALKGPASLVTSSNLDEAIKGSDQLRDVAYRVYRLELLRDPKNRHAQIMLWRWVQKFKGRALNDALGLVAKPPPFLLALARATPESVAMLERWDDLNSSIANASERLRTGNGGITDLHDVYYSRTQKEALKNEMLQIPELRSIVEISYGGSLRFADLRELLSACEKGLKPGQKVVLVDWFFVTDIMGNKQLYMASVKKDPSKSDGIDIRISAFPQFGQWGFAAERMLEEWNEKYLKPSKSPTGNVISVLQKLRKAEAFESLQLLRAVIQPLKDVSDPGDMLVLCPTRSMHYIPLHAMTLDEATGQPGQILIRRNPVVFCHSLSIFRLCVWSKHVQPPGQSRPSRPVAFFPLRFGQDDGRLRAQIGRIMDARVFEDEAVTSQTFVESSRGARSLFFLGHVDDAGSEPLKSHLVLYEKSPVTSCAAHQPDTIVATSTVLNAISLEPGASAMLIACGSGKVYAAKTDEYLGLIPAFLYGGARSTISTLWTISQYYGFRFAKLLLERWRAQGDSGSLNIAEAVQQAIIELLDEEDEDSTNLSIWAAFVFHGYWMNEQPLSPIPEDAMLNSTIEWIFDEALIDSEVLGTYDAQLDRQVGGAQVGKARISAVLRKLDWGTYRDKPACFVGIQIYFHHTTHILKRAQFGLEVIAGSADDQKPSASCVLFQPEDTSGPRGDVSRTMQGNLSPNIQAVGGGGSLGGVSGSESYTKHTAWTISGSPIKGPSQDTYGIEWYLKENGKEKDGVKPNVLVAVILEHERNPFSIRFTAEGTTGAVRERASHYLRRNNGEQEEEIRIFTPTEGSQNFTIQDLKDFVAPNLEAPVRAAA